MRNVGFTSLITQSLRRTELILLKPFSLKKCLKLLWIALLAGVLTSGGCNINLPNGPSGNKSTKVSESSKRSETAVNKEDSSVDLLGWSKQVSPNTWGIITFVIVLFLGWIIVFFLWLNARFEFVWWEAIVTNTTAIKDPFIRYREQGNSLFRFNVLMMGLFLVLGGLVAWSIYSMVTSGSIKLDTTPNWGSLISLGLTFLLLLILFFTAAALFAFIIYPQIVTLMALDHCSFLKAWEKFWEIYSRHVRDFWIFVGLSFGISIVAGILTAIIGVILVIILVLIGLIIGVPIAMLLAKQQLVLWILAVILGVPYIILFIVAMLLLCLPVAVFFRCFSLYFLSSLNCGYQPLLIHEPSKGEL